MKIECVRTSLRSPWQNGIAERWVDSCRRDLLDQVIALNSRHRRRLLADYVGYYHDDRTHLGLEKGTPNGRIRAIASGRVLPEHDSEGCIIVTIRQRDPSLHFAEKPRWADHNISGKYHTRSRTPGRELGDTLESSWRLYPVQSRKGIALFSVQMRFWRGTARTFITTNYAGLLRPVGQRIPAPGDRQIGGANVPKLAQGSKLIH